MRNLIFGILVASTAILGFVAYQSGQKASAANAELAAKSEAVAALEAEKTALTDQVATLQAQVTTLQTQVSDLSKAAADAAAALGVTTTTEGTAVEEATEGEATTTTP